VLLVLLCLLLAGEVTVGTGIYPPENARLLGTEAVVPLRWDLPGNDFFLTVTSSGRTVFQGAITGHTFELPVRSGALVRWSVVPFGQTSSESSFHSFQYSAQAVFRYQGKAGAKTARDPRALDGAPGAPGGDGPAVDVQLESTPDGVVLQVVGQRFLLLPSTRPIAIVSQGGPGGPGAEGQTGPPGQSFYGGGGYAVNLDGGPGGNGGQGGPGGRGGLITVVANGLPVTRFLQFDVRGGPGGPPGQGGRGGAPGFYRPPNHSSAYGPTVVGRAGPPGQSGQPGPEGPPGEVIVRP